MSPFYLARIGWIAHSRNVAQWWSVRLVLCPRLAAPLQGCFNLGWQQQGQIDLVKSCELTYDHGSWKLSLTVECSPEREGGTKAGSVEGLASSGHQPHAGHQVGPAAQQLASVQHGLAVFAGFRLF